MAKNDKYKRFHIIIGGEKGFIIRTTNKQEKVERWISAFIDACCKDTFIKVFERDTKDTYKLILNKTDKDVPNRPAITTSAPAPVNDGYRPVGFGRW